MILVVVAVMVGGCVFQAVFFPGNMAAGKYTNTRPKVLTRLGLIYEPLNYQYINAHIIKATHFFPAPRPVHDPARPSA